MPRRRQGDLVEVPGWVQGLLENAGPDIAKIGSIDEGLNIVPKPGNKIAVRGGSRQMQEFTSADASLGYDSFTDTDSTDITSHTADSGFGTWAGFTAVADIQSNRARYYAALGSDIQSGNNVANNDFTLKAECERNSASTGASQYGGLLFRGNGTTRGVGHNSMQFRWTDVSATTVKLEIGRQVDTGYNQEVTVLDAAYSWSRGTTKRMGVDVSGSDVTCWIEDTDGSNRTTFTKKTFTTDWNDASHQRMGWYGQGPNTTDAHFVDEQYADDTSAFITDTLAIKQYSATGAVVVGNDSVNSKHYAYLVDGEISTVGTRADLSTYWGAGEARPVIVELFENVYLADANFDTANRFPLLKVTSAGVVSVVAHNLGSGSANLRPYTIEEYAGVLFAAGYDDDSFDGAILRHSKLLTDPQSAGGFDTFAWAIIGARGKPITALKEGRGVLLVAKLDGLYRVFGDPQATSGWQFAIEALDFGVGYGCTGAYSLDYFNGWWYGVGEAGPWRSNGEVIENLADRRRDSWDAAADRDLELAWVAAHPQRQMIAFGVPSTTTPPTTIWIWDVLREQWFGDWELPFQMHMGAPVVSSENISPSGAPTGLTVSVQTGVGWDLDWTNTDTEASTQIWIRERGDVGNGTDGTFELYKTVAAGVSSDTVVGQDGFTHYEVKVRHIKAGNPSAFSTTEDAYTDILDVSWESGGAGGVSDNALKVIIHATNNSKNADIKIERRSTNSSCGSPGSWGSITVLDPVDDQPLGSWIGYDRNATCDQYYQYQVRVEDTSWPGTKDVSDWVQATAANSNGPDCAHACNDDGVPE